MTEPGPPQRSGQNRENHRRPEEFGRSLAQHALEEARKRKGGRDPQEPVVFDAQITVSPGSWGVCINLGLISNLLLVRAISWWKSPRIASKGLEVG
jgi:hypothetical protein